MQNERKLGEIHAKDTPESGCKMQENLVKFEPRVQKRPAVKCKKIWLNLSSEYRRVSLQNAKKPVKIPAKDTPKSGVKCKKT